MVLSKADIKPPPRPPGQWGGLILTRSSQRAPRAAEGATFPEAAVYLPPPSWCYPLGRAQEG
jgi:hypothetical protein